MKLAFWKYPVHFVAQGFGSGLVPVASGTFGSLVGVVLYWFMAPLAAVPYAMTTLGLWLVGVFVCGQTARDLGGHDPGSIVWDEIVGYLVAMYLLPRHWSWMLSGFALYRLFDIWKPFPIRMVERLPGGWGIMADDVVAGAYALALLHLARWGVQRFS